MRRVADEEALEWFLSPPKTCTLMDPNHGSSNPSVVGEKSSNNRNPKISGMIDFIDVLARRDDGNIPECFQERKKPDDSDETLEWFLSPPKICIVMESLREQKIQSPTAMVDGSVLRSRRAGENTLKELWTKFQAVSVCRIFYRDPVLQKEGKKIQSPVAMVDGSVLRSRRAGENTLKKELWTKFHAVSMDRIFYRDSVLQKEGKKGFMDMLEEAT